MEKTMKKDLSKDEETREFIKNIKPNKYYKMEGTSKVIIGKQLKKIYNATRNQERASRIFGKPRQED
jgi:uncharacterized protein with gpF-like domain